MNTLAIRGSIWTVPSVGTSALGLLISDARGVARGRPEYQVVPLIPAEIGNPHTEFDFLLAADETSLGRKFYAALWNLRPVLGADLGEFRGRVTSPEAMRDLRDAYLRLVDPSIGVRSGRLGNARVTDAVDRFRIATVRTWAHLSGRVLQRLHAPATEVFEIGGDWCRFYLDQLERFTDRTRESDNLIGQTRVIASGAEMGFVAVPLWTAASWAEMCESVCPGVGHFPVLDSFSRTIAVTSVHESFSTSEVNAVAALEEAA